MTRAMLEALRSREVSAVELARAACKRIEAHDRQINAIVVRDFERALAAASDADAALAAAELTLAMGPATAARGSLSAQSLDQVR